MLKRLNTLIWVLVILVLLGIAGYFAWQFYTPKEPFYVNLDQAAVVKEMRELNRLETATFTLEKIIEAGKTTTTGTSLEEFLLGDKILLIAHGQVIAGFDLAQMEEDDITINSETGQISVRLPAPEILVSRLDNDKTKVYDRTQGIFTKGDKDLESEARLNAELSIRQAACEGGILQQASDNGQKQITAFFSTMGFPEVSVQIPKGQCE